MQPAIHIGSEVTLSLTVHFGPTGFERYYVLSDDRGAVAWSPFSSMLLYAYHLEAREAGACRALTKEIPEGDDCHNVLRDEYFRRYAAERRVARTARSQLDDLNLEELGLL